jgi:hypothetical protein
MKQLFGLTVAETAMLSTSATAAPEPEHVRGTVSSINGDTLTVHTATNGDLKVIAGGDTKYLTGEKASLGNIVRGNYIGTATKNVGSTLVALGVAIFPPSMEGAAAGQAAWDRLPIPHSWAARRQAVP